jgi:pimeloyl-ACP methyl ester carboxylesterase
MPFADNEGVRIKYEVIGSGPPLLLHHGFGQRSNDWHRAGYVHALAASYTVILVDARGHGGSDKPYDKSAYTWPVQVFDIVTVLDRLDLTRAAYWGYSMGGEFGFGLALYAPERMSALVCGGASAHGSDIGTALHGIDGTDPDAFLEKLAARTGVSSINGDAKARFLENDLRALVAAAQDRPSLEQVLPHIRIPCFLYAGEADKDLAEMKDSARRMTQATFNVFPDLDHRAAFDRADVVLPPAMHFLQQALKSH